MKNSDYSLNFPLNINNRIIETDFPHNSKLPSGFSEEDILQLFIDEAEEILLLTNPSMEVEYVSESIERLLEIKVSDLTGKKVNDVLDHFPSLPLMKPNQKMVIPVTTPLSKRKFLIEFQFKPLFDNIGRVKAIFAIGRDVTDRENSLKKFKETAFKEKELNQLKSRFVSMASHEFRTPLATIQSSAMLIEMLLNKSDGPDTKERILNHVGKILNQTSRLTDITSDVLLLEKSIQPDLKIQLKKIPIAQFVNDLVKTINMENFERRIVKFFGPETDKNILTDSSLLVHILRNLILNALKYSEGALDPEVHIQFRGSFTEIMVKDYGLGIPKEDQEHIFGSFYRAKNVGNIKGTGLGLNIVKELTKKLNGEIWLNSKLGIGSEFFISLPSK
ncbi:PAS domain-containing sensor histidine kinase [Algoriphagus lacus]|uniref:histidine kinase n=1 Tax=Algoriphagus lacus TaxID=2056311 RepID=A0A418PNH1_9BACT|nr:PAS domain-containing sensor histidine kinase [Algoriphagus lacus]